MTELPRPEDRASTAELLAQAGWLRAVTRGLVGDLGAAEELEQETWRAALARPPRSGAGLRAWLYAVAHKLSLRGRRDASLRLHHEARAARGAGFELTDEASTLERLELQRRIVDAVRELREPYRTALTLRYLDDLGYPEIAWRTGIGEAAARKRVSRGLEELRTGLDRACGERSGWSLLAVSIARDLPLPRAAHPPLAPTPAGAGGAGSLIFGATAMTAGIKIGSAALAVVVVGASLLWMGRPDRQAGAREQQVAREVGTQLVPAPGPTSPSSPTAPGVGTRAPRSPADPVLVRPTTPPAVASKLEITGVVLGPEGRPRPEAEVRLVRGASLAANRVLGLDPLRPDETLDRTRTGADGRFAFTVVAERRYVLAASAPGLSEASVMGAYGGVEYELTLAPGASVSGIVSRPDGLPALGATVRLGLSGYPGVLERTARTSADGAYRFDGVAAGDYGLRVSSPEGATPPWESLEIAVGEELRIDIALEGGHLLRGRVTDASSGAPIPGAEVSEGLRFEKSVFADAAGEFRYESFPPTSHDSLRVRAGGYGTRRVKVLGYFDKLPENDYLEIELPPAIQVAGRVLDPAGVPVASAQVCCTARFQDGEVEQVEFPGTRTGEDGRYLIADLSPGIPHTLYVAKPGFGTSAWEIGAPAVNTELGDVTLAPGASVIGRVVDLEGVPVAGKGIDFAGNNEDRSERFGFELEDRASRAATDGLVLTDDAGRFRFSDLAAGSYTLSFRIGDVFGERFERTLEIESGDAVDLGRLEVDGGLSIEGHLFGTDGRGVNNELVHVATAGEFGPVAVAKTDPSGAFRVAGLKPGLYDLSVIGDTYGALYNYRDREPLGLTRLDGVRAGSRGVELHVPRAVILRGRVLTAAGIPLARAPVFGRRPGPGLVWSVQTSLDGTFELTVPAGEHLTLTAYDVVLDADGFGLSEFWLSLGQPGQDAPASVRLEDVPADGPLVTLRLP